MFSTCDIVYGYKAATARTWQMRVTWLAAFPWILSLSNAMEALNCVGRWLLEVLALKGVGS